MLVWRVQQVIERWSANNWERGLVLNERAARTSPKSQCLRKESSELRSLRRTRTSALPANRSPATSVESSTYSYKSQSSHPAARSYARLAVSRQRRSGLGFVLWSSASHAPDRRTSTLHERDCF